MKPLSLSRPHLIVMIGIPGSGKSTFAERFSETFKAPLVSQADLHDIIFGSRYGAVESEDKAIELADTILNELVKTGQTIIYEDNSGSRIRRQELAKLATSTGYRPTFVWVQTDSIEATRRSLRKGKDTLPLSPELFQAAVARFTIPVASEQAVVISGKHTYANQLKNVLRNLSADRPRPPLHVPRRDKIQ